MYNRQLLQLGLTHHQAQAYEYLLAHNGASVHRLTEHLQCHPQTTYRLLDQLQQLDLISVDQSANKQFIYAKDPVVWRDKVHERLATTEALLPKLQKIYTQPNESIVQLKRGDDAIRQSRRDILNRLKRGATYYVIGAEGRKYYRAMGDYRATFETARVAKKIKKEVIIHTSHKKDVHHFETKTALTTFHFLPIDLAMPTTTNIAGDTVYIYVWEADPIVITITDTAVAESYRQHFIGLKKLCTTHS